LRALVGDRPNVVVSCAIEEIETWMLALHRDDLNASWQTVRACVRVKEEFAGPFLLRLGNSGPSRGRKRAMERLSDGWRGLLQICPEVDQLRSDLRAAIDHLRNG
jgi:hypothetical protein